MKSKNFKSFLLLFGTILLLMSIPKQTVEKIRGYAASILSPGWSFLNSLSLYPKQFLGSKTTSDPIDPALLTFEEQLDFLKLQNQLLREEIVQLNDQNLHLHSFNVSSDNKGPARFEAVPARIIFRSPDTWNSSLWIDVGSADNERYRQKVIAKNSPVLAGSAVLGVIDYVGKYQSRVRLITDSGLTPSVRAVRGDPQINFLIENLSLAREGIARFGKKILKEENFSSVRALDDLMREIIFEQKILYMAKGELYGGSRPLWRSPGQVLKGVGFNYDFSDEEGPARDLRSGKVQGASSKSSSVPLLKIHDLLVTTGMDGVFPKGLNVAIVTKIAPLKEGDYYYELEARPAAGNLSDLSLVFVISPLGFDPEDQPPTQRL